MAITRIDGYCAGTEKASTTSWSIQVDTDAVVDQFLIGMLALDNAGTAGAAPGVTVTDSEGNTWTVLGGANKTSGAPNDGVSAYILYTQITFPLTAFVSTLDFAFDVAVTAKAMAVDRFSGVGALVGSATAATGSSGTPSVTDASVDSGNIVVGIVALEDDGAASWTADGDGTNGLWTAIDAGFFTNIGTTGGVATSNVRVGGATKIVTGTGAQTFNPTANSADWAALIVEFDDGFTPSPRYTMQLVDLNFNNDSRGINHLDPVNPQDVATMAYVLANAGGFPPTRIPASTTFSVPADSGMVCAWTPKIEAGAVLKVGTNGIVALI